MCSPTMWLVLATVVVSAVNAGRKLAAGRRLDGVAWVAITLAWVFVLGRL